MVFIQLHLAYSSFASLFMIHTIVALMLYVHVLSLSLCHSSSRSFTSFSSCSRRHHSPASSNISPRSPIYRLSLLNLDHHIIRMVTFTPAEDHHIIRLKEQVGGTWNNIQAAFAGLFPGTERNAGGLQVRYSRYLQAGKGSRAAALVFGKSILLPSHTTLLSTLLSSMKLCMNSITCFLGSL